jgi:hypothetical protein
MQYGSKDKRTFQVGVSDGPPTRYALYDLDDLQGRRLIIR